MSARVQTTIFVASLVLWVGAVVFFSLVVLPALFVQLETAQAGNAAAAVFPLYYRLGTAVGLAMLLSAAAMARDSGLRWRLATLTAAVMLACHAYAAIVVHPRVADLRAQELRGPEFDSAHQLSVRLNAVVLIGGMTLLCASGSLLERR